MCERHDRWKAEIREKQDRLAEIALEQYLPENDADTAYRVAILASGMVQRRPDYEVAYDIAVALLTKSGYLALREKELERLHLQADVDIQVQMFNIDWMQTCGASAASLGLADLLTHKRGSGGSDDGTPGTIH